MQRWRDPVRQLRYRMVRPRPASPLFFVDTRGIIVCQLSNRGNPEHQSRLDKDVPLWTASCAAELTVRLLTGSWSYRTEGGEEVN